MLREWSFLFIVCTHKMQLAKEYVQLCYRGVYIHQYTICHYHDFSNLHSHLLAFLQNTSLPQVSLTRVFSYQRFGKQEEILVKVQRYLYLTKKTSYFLFRTDHSKTVKKYLSFCWWSFKKNLPRPAIFYNFNFYDEIYDITSRHHISTNDHSSKYILFITTTTIFSLRLLTYVRFKNRHLNHI